MSAFLLEGGLLFLSRAAFATLIIQHLLVAGLAAVGLASVNAGFEARQLSRLRPIQSIDRAAFSCCPSS
jgi:hypothetical protein